jgi:phosphorylase/glycogen(starch) synthase
MNNIDYLFETSWEVCNKVGGIHTVIMTKAKTMSERLNNNYILIGPDLNKSEKENNEFLEDKNMFNSWKSFAQDNGLKFRIGHWNIQQEPIVILVDFTQYFAVKDKIFAQYWEEYKVDSLTGGWDYIEPFLFGYAAAKVIESYYDFYLSSQDKIVAQFHEWMTGSGILYLKKYVPQIATCFTTHATVLGRCLAGNNLPLYSELNHFDGEVVANNFNVVSKYSLEKLSALNADGFSTVSEITNRECKQFFGKTVDSITPNGFDDSFVPKDNDFTIKRKAAREKIFSILEQQTGRKDIDKNSFLIINSGRYEFKNKGIDVFIKAMSELNKKQDLKQNIIAVVAIPAGQIEDTEHDPILCAIKNSGIKNTINDKVNILFLPYYIDENDGVTNLSYFDFLTAFDLSIFPSYYEPWGYTPMESMAFGIASITTSLAGFGLWVKDNINDKNNALTVINRDDNNMEACVNDIVNRTYDIINSEDNYKQTLKEEAVEIFKKVTWKELANYYYKVYDMAIEKANSRVDKYIHKQPLYKKMTYSSCWGNSPSWKKILVKLSLPERLSGLQKLSQNLWWSWNYDAFELFCKIDKQKFFKFERSPIHLIESLTQEDHKRLLNDKDFLNDLDNVMNHFNTYLQQREKKDKDIIAYFSMEFGIHDTLKIFSGGLGMLAGDYLKQASDSNKNIVGIGLLYRQGYFTQHITKEGIQESERFNQKFSHLPIQAVRDENGKWRKISINLPSRTLFAKIWRCDIGAVPLYLLDTDIDDNNEQDRQITSQLYGGDNENRLKQEILLGIGGVRLLEELNIKPTLFHSNEGHSAFSSLERLNNYINKENMSYSQAIELVRSSTLFTTHTPVPAGHDSFSEEMMRIYFSAYSQNLTLDWEHFMLLGRKSNDNPEDKFSMSVLAINCSANVNGVSRIHGRVTKEMFAYLYDGYYAKELNMGYVTNGVHLPTWVSKSWLDIYNTYFDKGFIDNQSDERYWQKIYDVDDKVIWKTHKDLKKELITFVKQRLEKELRQRAEDPQLYFKIINQISEDKLTIGFARRFATYKRANLLFTNLERLEEICNRGVQFIFAGKAHPNDKAGQDLISNIIRISKMPQFIGKVIFIENYDMYVAKQLVRGVDIWLNTPTRPLEASGTSGEKAIMNGVVNFSVLDGWWAEGWKEEAGFALPEEITYNDTEPQNILDAEMIYDTFEQKIIPYYYSLDEDNIPKKWVAYIKNTIAMISPHFTMKRQLDDYFNKYYNHMIERVEMMTKNDCEACKEYSAWKLKMRRLWNSIELISYQVPDSEDKIFSINDHFKAKVCLYLGDIDAENVGVEMIITHKENDKINSYARKEDFVLTSFKNQKAEYTLDFNADVVGVHDYAFRIYPKHPLMPFREDLPLIKWI